MKTEIKQHYQINATPEFVRHALVEEHGLQAWWTTEAVVMSDGTAIAEWSGKGWKVEMDVAKTSHGDVVWHCQQSNLQNNSEWANTQMVFKLESSNGGTSLDLIHSNYKDTSPGFKQSEADWKFYLGTSLKQYLETGKGMPYEPTSELVKA